MTTRARVRAVGMQRVGPRVVRRRPGAGLPALRAAAVFIFEFAVFWSLLLVAGGLLFLLGGE